MHIIFVGEHFLQMPRRPLPTTSEQFGKLFSTQFRIGLKFKILSVSPKRRSHSLLLFSNLFSPSKLISAVKTGQLHSKLVREQQSRVVSPFDVDQRSVGNDPSEDCVYTSTVVQYKNLGAFQPSGVYLPIHAKCYSSFFENVAAPANQSSSKTVNFLFSLLLKWIETIISCSTILPNNQLESLAGFVGY